MAKGNSYLSTGEAAKLLNISRSTVSRRFDLGLFQGKLNPITGERLISVESVGDFIKKHDLPIDPSKLGQKAVVLASTDGKLRAAVDEAIANDKRVALAVVALGTDTLIACSRTTPQLLVLDERLPDLPCSQVIGSLRKQEEQRLLRILCCLGATNQETARSWGADDYLSISDGFQGKELRSRLYQLLGIQKAAATDTTPTEHKRRWPRLPADFPAKIGIYRLSAPYECSWGRAVVENISEGGAYLSRIQLDDPTLPAEPFRLLMKVDGAPLDGWQADCQMVRLNTEEPLGAGVKFVKISKSNRQQIAELAAA